MKITNVDVYTLRAPLAEPFGFSQFTYTHREATLVRVRTDEGLEGWGEAYGPARPSSTVARDFFGPMLAGRDPRDTEAIWAFLFARSIDYGQKGTMLCGLSAIDIALWDIKSQAAGVPLYRLLGGEETKSIPCYATGFYFGGDEPLADRFAREARSHVAAGFRAVKMKVGLGVEQDAELVGVVREAVGPGVALMIDANHAYMPADAIRLARLVEPLDIGWFEEPVSPIDIEAYREVKKRTAIPIAGGECEYTRFGFEPWFRKRALDIVQPDLCACGGVSEGMKIATLASLTGIHVTPHVWGSAIGQAAALHYYAARPRHPSTLIPERRLIECDRTEHPLRTAIVEAPIPLVEGEWVLPTQPGLGVKVQVEALDEFRWR